MCALKFWAHVLFVSHVHAEDALSDLPLQRTNIGVSYPLFFKPGFLLLIGK